MAVLWRLSVWQCPKRLISAALNPNSHTCPYLSISPGLAYPRMVGSATHSPVTQPPFCFQGCLSPLDGWEYCQHFAAGPTLWWTTPWLQLSLSVVTGALDKLLQIVSMDSHHRSSQCRPIWHSWLNLYWALLFQLPWWWHLQSCCHAMETLSF